MKNTTSETEKPAWVEIFEMYPLILLVQLASIITMAGFGITGVPSILGSLAVVAIMYFLFGDYNPGVVYYRRMGIAYRLLTLFLVFLSIYAIPTVPAETQIPVWGIIALFIAISNLLKKGEEIKLTTVVA